MQPTQPRPVGYGRPMLWPGARVAVVAPAGVFHPDRTAAGCALAAGWGLDLIMAPNAGARTRYLAGTVAQRTADLVWALTAPDIDAVWFARGGYGTAQCLVGIPWGEVAPDRLVIGFSDATALFTAMLGMGVGRPVHGPVLNALAALNDPASQAALRALLMDGEGARLPGEQVAGPEAEVVGPVVGGNLAVLASLAGTRFAARSYGAILLLEDVGEAPYRLDRTLSQLLASGALDGVRGVALGEFSGCRAPEGADWAVQDVLVDLLAPLGVPVVAGLPVGHGPTNYALRLGAPGRLHAGGLDVDGG